MYKSLLALIIYFVIFVASQTTVFACECKYLLVDSTADYRDDNLLNAVQEKNCLIKKTFLDLLVDARQGNQIVIYKTQKSAWLAFGLSVLYPGLGQLYNGEYGKSFLMAGLTTLGLAAFYYGASSTDFDGNSDNKSSGAIAITGVIVGSAVYIWSLIDAPVSANKINGNNEVKAGTKSRLYVLSSRTERSLVNLKLKIPLNFY